MTHAALHQQLWDAIAPILDDPLREGERARRGLEEEFAQAVGRRYAIAVRSGTMGLFLALLGCGIGAGDEVITVANSDISTIAAMSHCGAVPVLCDIRANDYTIDPDLVETLVTPRTAALLPVDLYGHPADVKALRAIAQRHGLLIIEDAALAAGAEDYGLPVGSFADAAVFSFATLKPLGGAGNGGMIATDSDVIAQRARVLCHYGARAGHAAGQPGHQAYTAEGYNVPMDPIQAAIIHTKLPHLPAWTARRREIAATYAAGLASTRAHLPTFRPESAPTFRSYTIRVPDRDTVYAGLLATGVEAVLHYVPPQHLQPVYSGRLRGSDCLPVTERAAKELLCLPVFPELTAEEVGYAVDTLGRLLQQEELRQ